MKISIVTVVLNRKVYIKKVIENVLEQNFDDFEHIIIDGGSTDGTVDVIKSYPHLKWISEKDNGSVYALNKGLAMVTGDVFGWLNSDESYLPGVLHKVNKYFIDNPSWEVIHGASQFVDEDDNVIGSRKSHRKLLPYSLTRLMVGFNFLAVPSSVFVRCTAMQKVGFRVDENWGHVYDYELWVRLAKVSHVQHVPECLSRFGIHQDSGLVKTPMAAREELKRLRKLNRSQLNMYHRTIGTLHFNLYMFLYRTIRWNKMIKGKNKK
jgi:glycosyltransferase involved in cell wall biosynthesis